MGRNKDYHGETCPNCGSDYTYLITRTPRDVDGNPITGCHRWKCNDCNQFFLVNA